MFSVVCVFTAFYYFFLGVAFLLLAQKKIYWQEGGWLSTKRLSCWPIFHLPGPSILTESCVLLDTSYMVSLP